MKVDYSVGYSKDSMNYGRQKQRGKHLLDFCQRARTTHEWAGDKRVFCSGLIDAQTDDILPECRECGAWCDNAKPSEELKKQWESKK
ncbi:MAG: hypothetical protein WCS21_10815 [Lachnospiraceae bacterium]